MSGAAVTEDAIITYKGEVAHKVEISRQRVSGIIREMRELNEQISRESELNPGNQIASLILRKNDIFSGCFVLEANITAEINNLTREMRTLKASKDKDLLQLQKNLVELKRNIPKFRELEPRSRALVAMDHVGILLSTEASDALLICTFGMNTCVCISMQGRLDHQPIGQLAHISDEHRGHMSAIVGRMRANMRGVSDLKIILSYADNAAVRRIYRDPTAINPLFIAAHDVLGDGVLIHKYPRDDMAANICLNINTGAVEFYDERRADVAGPPLAYNVPIKEDGSFELYRTTVVEHSVGDASGGGGGAGSTGFSVFRTPAPAPLLENPQASGVLAESAETAAIPAGAYARVALVLLPALLPPPTVPPDHHNAEEQKKCCGCVIS